MILQFYLPEEEEAETASERKRKSLEEEEEGRGVGSRPLPVNFGWWFNMKMTGRPPSLSLSLSPSNLSPFFPPQKSPQESNSVGQSEGVARQLHSYSEGWGNHRRGQPAARFFCSLPPRKMDVDHSACRHRNVSTKKPREEGRKIKLFLSLDPEFFSFSFFIFDPFSQSVSFFFFFIRLEIGI